MAGHPASQTGMPTSTELHACIVGDLNSTSNNDILAWLAAPATDEHFVHFDLANTACTCKHALATDSNGAGKTAMYIPCM